MGKTNLAWRNQQVKGSLDPADDSGRREEKQERELLIDRWTLNVFRN